MAVNQAHLELIDALYETENVTDEGLKTLLTDLSEEEREYLREKAEEKRINVYGKEVFLRGLIEFTNICKNDCYYCGIRKSNGNVDRYRLTPDQVYACVEAGYELGFRTFVLQGGEDGHYATDEVICNLIRGIKERHPDCALTMSIGERSRESYQAMYDAGADRYLLRHETANADHYRKLHPDNLTLENRMRCLYDLKDIGYQVGCGMMIGAPYQTLDHYIQDLRFMQNLNPHMIGIGPFIPHKDTCFKDEPAGTLEETLLMLSILRLLFPKANLPATTALGTIDPTGREKGILHGANVIMPNLSPDNVRENYLLYDNKVGTDVSATQSRADIERRMATIGYHCVVSRGDSKVE